MNILDQKVKFVTNNSSLLYAQTSIYCENSNINAVMNIFKVTMTLHVTSQLHKFIL